MAKLNIILEAKARDRGARKQLRDLTTLADGVTEAMTRASAASQGVGSLGGLGGGPVAPGGGGRRRRPPPPPRARAPRRAKAAPQRAKKRVNTERAFDKALEGALKDQRSIARSLNMQDREQRKAARNIRNMTDEQLVGVELERESNRRRRKMARQTASGKLGPDPSRRGGGGRGKLEMAENLAVAGAEFEQFGDRVEQGVRASFDSFKDFEKAVVEVSTLTDDISIEEIREITEGAAKEFGGLPTDQVKAFYGIVSAGATTAAEATEQLRAANQLATGGVATQEEAVLAISKAVANFGVTSTEAADSLFTAVKDGQTTVSQLATAMPQVAQAASDVGLSLDETNVAIAVLSKRGATAKVSANNLKAAISNLKNPTKAASKEAKRLGIEFNSGAIKAAGGLQEFLLKLRAAEKFDDDTITKLFGSVEAQAAVGGLIGGMEDVSSGLVDMAGNTGAAAIASDKMMETAAKKADLLNAKWELLKISAGESLVPALTDLAEEVGPLIEDFTTWIKENPKLAGTMAKVAIGIGVASKGISIFTSGLSMVSTLSGLASKDVTRLGTTATKTGGKLGKLSSVNLAGPFIAATAAIAAFELVLDKAQAPLKKFEDTVKGIAEEQGNISFKDEQGKDKSESELLSERRGRLISVVNAARTAEFESTGGGGGDENIFQRSVAGYASALNRATGVTEELSMQTSQAEKDLAAFDQQFGSAAGLTEAQKFEDPGAGGFDPASLERMLFGIEAIASNTAGGGEAVALGPSMESGATS